jgi:RNA polymerase sigma factor (sigma-70 family)
MTTDFQQQIAETPTLSAEQQRKLAARAKCDDQKALGALWRANMKMVAGIVQRKSTPQDYGDLFSESYLLFCDAVKRFDLDRGTAFSTFLYKTVDEGLKRVKTKLPVVRVPDRLFYGGRAAEVVSMDEELGEDDFTLHDMIASEEHSPCERLERTEVREYVRKYLDRLKERDKAIVTRRFGLDGREALSEVRVGQEYGITGAGIGHITRTAIEKMRVMMTSSGLLA